MNDDQALRDFVAKYARPYDPETDDYDRPPFAADIKEGKNDPIYNAHSYHTKVPPRGIIPYILHYTKPGDLILDPFCGSGMTGVAAQMCANPPAGLLEQFPELKERVGPRHAILNDLSPAACHIACNYNTPVNVDALKHEFGRIMAAVKDKFDWLYGTEHYEPAIGLYDPKNSDVAERLKNLSSEVQSSSRMFQGGPEQTWELINRDEVERRLGYLVTDLPRSKGWGDLDMSRIDQWIAIPAIIQYTIWSDVYRCEGFVTVEEPTGRISTRGKNAGKPISRKNRVARGCGQKLTLWHICRDGEAITDVFVCPSCGQQWEKVALSWIGMVPVSTDYTFCSPDGRGHRSHRPVSTQEKARITEAKPDLWNLWYPAHPIYPFRELMTMSANKRGVSTTADFYTRRNLTGLAILWQAISAIKEPRLRAFARFAFTAVIPYCCRKQNYGGGGGGMSGTLYLPSFHQEKNVWDVFVRKIEKLEKDFTTWKIPIDFVLTVTGSASQMGHVPDNSVDYVFTDPPFGGRSYWILGSSAPMLSEKCNVFLRPLKNKGFKEERVTTMRLDDLGHSTTLESNKSLGGNIFYADASLLWESWLNEFTDEAKEMVFHRRSRQQREADGFVFKTLEDYARDMSTAFQEMFRILKPGRWATVEFNNSDGTVFEAIKAAATDAGFEIVNMLLLDKEQKSFKQVQGAKGEQDVVDKDVLFNLHKPALALTVQTPEDHDLEQKVTEAVREHLLMLPDRVKTDPAKYSDEHRTTATINSMLMNTLIPNGVSVERLNLPFIERVCSRYFRKVGQRWYLRGEAVGGKGDERLFAEEIGIKDELTAIAWLRQKLQTRSMLVGELKPLWMRATGMLPGEVSRHLMLEDLLSENFWRDADTNRWREPTDEERERMNDDRSLRVLHDAERFVAETLRRATTDAERCEWIEVLFKACEADCPDSIQSR